MAGRRCRQRILFAVEYWELEQAKLKKASSAPALEGKVALVTGAASGIGKACVEELMQSGACVLALDIKPEITSLYENSRVLGLHCDVTDVPAVMASLEQGIAYFGGLDMLVSNAGSFTASQSLSEMSDENWQSSMAVNLDSHMKLMRCALPFLKQGLDPAIVIIASKNVPAPGPGAGAYSVAKAGLTQLARVAALELGEDGIRVNVLHPNAVFDTGVWDEETLATRAAHYGLSVEQYKQNNVLGKDSHQSRCGHYGASFCESGYRQYHRCAGSRLMAVTTGLFEIQIKDKGIKEKGGRAKSANPQATRTPSCTHSAGWIRRTQFAQVC